MSVYEVHLVPGGAGRTGQFLNYRELAEPLVKYVKALGFTHIELLPITEHPFDGSWGYQTTGYFHQPAASVTRMTSAGSSTTATSRVSASFWIGYPPISPRMRMASPGSTARRCTNRGPRVGEHRDWGTLIYNYGRNEVRNFLIGSAVYWLEEFHLDGLRVDAVASMLYLDYSREAGDWIPNKYGGNENLEAIAFLRELNTVTHQQCPGTLIMAEESTAWPQVPDPPGRAVWDSP